MPNKLSRYIASNGVKQNTCVKHLSNILCLNRDKNLLYIEQLIRVLSFLQEDLHTVLLKGNVASACNFFAIYECVSSVTSATSAF